MIHRLCTDQFIRAELSDKMQGWAAFDPFCLWLDKQLRSVEKGEI
jgi:hypothetical protein